MSTAHAENSHLARRTPLGSGAVARLLTVLYVLVTLPISLAALSFGGTHLGIAVQQARFGSGISDHLLTADSGMRILLPLALGLVLLASIVATGMASSAGLLVAGAVGLVGAALSAFPSLMLLLFTHAPAPIELLNGIIYGFPLVLPLLLGGAGTALALARRRPEAGTMGAVLGLLLIPAGLLVAAVLLFQAHARGVLLALRNMQVESDPLMVLLVALGSVLLWVSTAASRWSPYALVIPGIVLTAASAAMLVPDRVPLADALWSSPGGTAAFTFVHSGGGIAAAVILLAHTVVLAAVRARARRRPRESAAG